MADEKIKYDINEAEQPFQSADELSSPEQELPEENEVFVSRLAGLVEEKFDRVYFKDIIEAIFATDDRQVADAIIQEYNKYWQSIIGTRGATGKKTVNAKTGFGNLFEEV